MDDAKQLVSRFVDELWNERRLDVADAIFAENCVTHQLRSGAPTDAVPRGPQAIKEHVAGWIASFPAASQSGALIQARSYHCCLRKHLREIHHSRAVARNVELDAAKGNECNRNSDSEAYESGTAHPLPRLESTLFPIEHVPKTPGSNFLAFMMLLLP